MRHRAFPLALTVALALPVGAAAAQQPAPAGDSMVAMRATAVHWTPVETPGFAPGMEMGVIAGNPQQAGPYTIRLRFPSGYAFPAHLHPNDENLTVLAGRFFLGMGEKSDPSKLTAYAPGDYLRMPGGRPHFGRVEGQTVIQLHGTGPFVIKLAGTPTSDARR